MDQAMHHIRPPLMEKITNPTRTATKAYSYNLSAMIIQDTILRLRPTPVTLLNKFYSIKQSLLRLQRARGCLFCGGPWKKSDDSLAILHRMTPRSLARAATYDSRVIGTMMLRYIPYQPIRAFPSGQHRIQAIQPPLLSLQELLLFMVQWTRQVGVTLR